jgi:hypothetical protein
LQLCLEVLGQYEREHQQCEGEAEDPDGQPVAGAQVSVNLEGRKPTALISIRTQMMISTRAMISGILRTSPVSGIRAP